MIKIVLVNLLISMLCVIVHYEFLYHSTDLLPKLNIRHRFKILLAVFIVLTAHIIEIWIYAYGYLTMHNSAEWGSLHGNYDGSIFDSMYFSFATFTTLGFGDIQPIGEIRFLVGVESLIGFVLNTWSASFLFFEMQRFWNNKLD